MSDPFGELLCEHALLSFEKQFVLAGLLDEDHDWAADLDAGTVTLGPHTWACQLIGTESEADDSWLWGWANPSGFGPAVLKAAEQLRALGQQKGVAELTERKVPIERAGGHAMSLIAAGACGGNAYYRGPYDGGAAFLLIRDPAFPAMPPASAQVAAQVLTALISAVEVPDHRKALMAYARQRKLSASGSGNAMQLRFPGNGGTLAVEFDELKRATSIQA